MNTPHFSLPRRRLQRGFTLVELMVGIVLGMLTVLVITQTMAVTEGKKRTISSGSDAQVNGTLALYTLQRELQMSGYGVASNPVALGCPVKGKFKDPAAPADSAAIDFAPVLAPVVIADGADGAPDTITILQGQTANFSAPMPVSTDHAKDAGAFEVGSSLGVTAGDLMIAVPRDGQYNADQWCAVFSVTDDGNAESPTSATLTARRIPHTTGSNPWNTSDVFPEAGYERGAFLLNLGRLSHRTYSIDNESLQVRAQTSGAATSTAEELYPQIVNLQAMYGKDTTGDGQIDTYDNTTPTTAADWERVLAVRLALVARSTQYERDPVTTSAPQWQVGTGTPLTLRINHVSDWQHYRYKVYDTIVPLRNMLWNSKSS